MTRERAPLRRGLLFFCKRGVDKWEILGGAKSYPANIVPKKAWTSASQYGIMGYLAVPAKLARHVLYVIASVCKCQAVVSDIQRESEIRAMLCF